MTVEEISLAQEHASEWAELALVMDALVATTGLLPRPRPGQTLEMAMVLEGLASVAAKAGVPQPAPTKTTKKPAMPRCNEANGFQSCHE
jgi:hypothetical protein